MRWGCPPYHVPNPAAVLPEPLPSHFPSSSFAPVNLIYRWGNNSAELSFQLLKQLNHHSTLQTVERTLVAHQPYNSQRTLRGSQKEPHLHRLSFLWEWCCLCSSNAADVTSPFLPSALPNNLLFVLLSLSLITNWHFYKKIFLLTVVVRFSL